MSPHLHNADLDLTFSYRCFALYYVPMMKTQVHGFPVVAACCVVVLMVWSVVAFVSTSKLQPPEEPEEWFQVSFDTA